LKEENIENIRRPCRTVIKIILYDVISKKDFITNNKGKVILYDVISKKDFITNNKGKVLVYIYQENIYKPVVDKVYFQLADSLTIIVIFQNTSQYI